MPTERDNGPSQAQVEVVVATVDNKVGLGKEVVVVRGAVGLEGPWLESRRLEGREVERVEVVDPEANAVPDRRLEEVLPPPEGDLLKILLNQCWQILSARNLHMLAGYAAVGAVSKPPLELRPIIVSR